MLNILLIEDDLDDQEFFLEGLVQINLEHHLTILNDCVRLKDFFFKNPPCDLIFIDSNLPIVDTNKCIDIIRKENKYQKTPIVMIGGVESKMKATELYKLGVHYFLIKSPSQTNFIKSLNQIFSINWKEPQQIPLLSEFVINSN